MAGITDQDGYLWQSYRYDAFGNATFGSPQYDNEYTFNGESYNPNIHSQYLRARYYDTLEGIFLTEDTYLGDIMNPLTLNRYSYCIGNPLFYSDPSGHWGVDLAALENEMMNILNERDRRLSDVTDYIYDKTGEILGTNNETEVAQIVSGFVAGFAGSFYETFDLITNPEIILATVFEAVTHPIETALGVIKNKYTKGIDVFFQYLVEENYRMIGQEVGRMAGEKLQDLIAAAVVATVLKTCGDGNGGEGDSKPRLNTYGDALREKLGPVYLSNPEEYNAILNDAKEKGVSVEFRKGTLAYDMEFGKPGKLIIDLEASIGGLRHEYRHMLDDFSLEHPGMRIIADSDKFWELEFRGYLEELNLAREIKDFDAEKFIIGEMRQRRKEILGR